MKQKLVVGVQMDDAKKRSRALKLIVGFPGVISVSIEGDAKTHIVVIGEGVDSIVLVSALRKKMGFAELKNVGNVEDKKTEEKKPAVAAAPPAASILVAPPTSWAYQYRVGAPHQHAVYLQEPLAYNYGYNYKYDEDSSCSVM